jgi:hypothetical protein
VTDVTLMIVISFSIAQENVYSFPWMTALAAIVPKGNAQHVQCLKTAHAVLMVAPTAHPPAKNAAKMEHALPVAQKNSSVQQVAVARVAVLKGPVRTAVAVQLKQSAVMVRSADLAINVATATVLLPMMYAVRWMRQHVKKRVAQAIKIAATENVSQP